MPAKPISHRLAVHTGTIKLVHLFSRKELLPLLLRKWNLSADNYDELTFSETACLHVACIGALTSLAFSVSEASQMDLPTIVDQIKASKLDQE